MRERVDDLVGCGADAAWIMTFHAACVRILRRLLTGSDTGPTLPYMIQMTRKAL